MSHQTSESLKVASKYWRARSGRRFIGYFLRFLNIFFENISKIKQLHSNLREKWWSLIPNMWIFNKTRAELEWVYISAVTEYSKTGYSTNIRPFWSYSKPTFQNWIYSTPIRIRPQYSTIFADIFGCKIVHFLVNFSWIAGGKMFFLTFFKKNNTKIKKNKIILKNLQKFLKKKLMPEKINA